MHTVIFSSLLAKAFTGNVIGYSGLDRDYAITYAKASVIEESFVRQCSNTLGRFI
jgi:hypothetical protein